MACTKIIAPYFYIFKINRNWANCAQNGEKYYCNKFDFHSTVAKFTFLPEGASKHLEHRWNNSVCKEISKRLK